MAFVREGPCFKRIAAVILAAGQSRRMGRAKINLPWGDTTILGQIIFSLSQAGVAEMLIVVGEARVERTEDWSELSVRLVHNPEFAETGMLRSLQLGLEQISSNARAALVVLGDQPQMETNVVSALLELYFRSLSPLTAPSFQMRRGHPWLVDRMLWQSLLALPASATLRDFFNVHSHLIRYLPVETPTVLQDLDTPEEYEHFRPH